MNWKSLPDDGEGWYVVKAKVGEYVIRYFGDYDIMAVRDFLDGDNWPPGTLFLKIEDPKPLDSQ